MAEASTGIDYGGPAFPMAPHANNQNWSDGMTLRDYFAAKALNGWLSTWPVDQECGSKNYPAIAEFCYELADAMIAQKYK